MSEAAVAPTAGVRLSRRPSALLLLRAAGLLLVAAVLVPVLVLLSSWASPEGDVWQHLADTQLAQLLLNTVILMVGVGLLVTVLGVSLAWCTAMCDFHII